MNKPCDVRNESKSLTHLEAKSIGIYSIAHIMMYMIGARANILNMSARVSRIYGISCFSSASKKQGPRKTANKWIKRHEKDPYVKKARAQGSPSRAIFKLEEIDKMAAQFIKKKTKIFKIDKLGKTLQRGSTVIDLGAAPGGWTQFAAKKIHSDGVLIAVDLLPLDDMTVNAITNDQSGPLFHAIQGDFTNNSVKDDIFNFINDNNYGEVNSVDESIGADYIMSDMAANFTGDQLTDALRTMNLCEDALMFAVGPSCFDERYVAGSGPRRDGLLNRGGSFLCKFFACGQENEMDLMQATKRHFKLTTILKPKASRKESAELYLFATGYNGGR